MVYTFCFVLDPSFDVVQLRVRHLGLLVDLLGQSEILIHVVINCLSSKCHVVITCQVAFS